LKNKTTDPVSAARHKYGILKLNKYKLYSKTVFTYIQGLKDRILTEAGGDPKKPEQKFKEDNLDVATRIMIEKGEGPKLLAALGNLKKSSWLLIRQSILHSRLHCLLILISRQAEPRQAKSGKELTFTWFRPWQLLLSSVNFRTT
jgi:hypothetical protein